MTVSILVVDDERDVAELFRQQLERKPGGPWREPAINGGFGVPCHDARAAQCSPAGVRATEDDVVGLFSFQNE
jgi:CheY-like chemotaxis protein